MDSGFCTLNIREQELLEKLLEAAIHGHDELRTQLSQLTAKQIENDGTLKLQCHAGPRAPGKYALVAEGICKDAAGSDIAIFLHLGKDGFMSMLEIMKYDGPPIINPPSARDLVLLMPEHGGRKPDDPPVE